MSKDLLNRNLIITSGGSQLLYQIASLIDLNEDVSSYDLVYIGEEAERLEPILKGIARAYFIKGFFTIKNIPWKSDFSNNSLLKRFALSFRKKEKFNKLFSGRLSSLRKYRGQKVIIPVRHNMRGDALLLEVLRPSKTFLVIDGVINTLQKRNIKFNAIRSFSNILSKIPSNETIYAPIYLKKEAQLLGQFVAISDKVLREVFDKATRSIDLQPTIEYLKAIDIKSVIFSQHLALSNVCSLKEEVNYYLMIVKKLIDENSYPILFKAHPRDQSIKLEKIENGLKNFKKKVIFLSIDLEAIPSELLLYSFNNLRLITANSSAPLSLTHLSESIFCYSTKAFSHSFIEDIKSFSSTNNLTLRSL